MALNPRQKKFAEAYHLGGNATRAYVEAYGASEAVAAVKAWHLVRNDKVREYLEELEKEAKEEFRVTRAEMLRGFKEIFDSKGREETRDRISAGKEICRIEGHYSKQEFELSADDSLAEVLQAITGAKTK